ncbi:MAG: elongation factor 1-alpha, partial [Methanobacteriota archaeon]
MPAKPHLNLVFIGHVDHGKSTTVGRILYDTGNIDPHELENLKKLAEQMGKATFEFAFVMDQVKEERERGLTIDVAHKRFDTDKYYFTIIDAPGHRDFVKNMITGTSQADAAVLVVGAAEGVQTQTKEHIYLAKVLGVEQLIVAINKMDATKPEYSEKRFTELKTELTGLLKVSGFKVDRIPFIPISSYKGENITKPSSKLAWYKGPSLVPALNDLTVPPKPTNLPLRLPVQDVYSITGAGTVPVGRVETGLLKVGMKIHFMPSDKVGEVKSIEMHHEQIPQAEPGDNVGFNVRGVDKKDLRRGDV